MPGLIKAEFMPKVKMNVPGLFPFYFIRRMAYLILHMATYCHTTESVGASVIWEISTRFIDMQYLTIFR